MIDPSARQHAAPARCPLSRRWRWVGAAAFTFFLVKGLLWLAIPALIAMGLLSR